MWLDLEDKEKADTTSSLQGACSVFEEQIEKCDLLPLPRVKHPNIGMMNSEVRGCRGSSQDVQGTLPGY